MPSFIRTTPQGEDRERLTCPDCGFIAYENPKIVVGSVVAAWRAGCCCAGAPSSRGAGFWTLPAGYMELGETVEEGAAREAWEEARARIGIEGVLAVYSIARIGQVQVIFRAHFAEPGFEAGPESLEVGLFGWAEVPWEDIAFPSVHWALRAWRETADGPLGGAGAEPALGPARHAAVAGHGGEGPMTRRRHLPSLFVALLAVAPAGGGGAGGGRSRRGDGAARPAAAGRVQASAGPASGAAAASRRRPQQAAPAPETGPRLEAAPVPNRDLEAPRDPTGAAGTAPGCRRASSPGRCPNQGMATEGTPSIQEERLFFPAPGARLNVPFSY